MTEANGKITVLDALRGMHEELSALQQVRDLKSQIDTLEHFIARRFDELSMEVNATSQLVGMAEEGIDKKFADVFDTLSAISWYEDGKTPANTGVELEAIVQATEQAANTILDSVDRIGDKLSEGTNWEDPHSRASFISGIDADLQEIVMACSFQDLTSQRVRKTLESIKDVEEKLQSTLEKFGVQLPKTQDQAAEDHTEAQAKPTGIDVQTMDQGDIDSLFD